MTDRRTFVSAVAGGLVVWPLAAHAQRQVLPVIGYLANASAAGFTNYVDAFRRGLGEMGYVEGQNVAIATNGVGCEICDTGQLFIP